MAEFKDHILRMMANLDRSATCTSLHYNSHTYARLLLDEASECPTMHLSGSMLCCAVLCCAVLCCALLTSYVVYFQPHDVITVHMLDIANRPAALTDA